VLPPDAAAEPGSAVGALVAEAVGPEAAEDPDLDWRRYGPELALALFDAELNATEVDDGSGGLRREAPVPPASEQLAGAIGNPRLRDRLGLDAGLGAEVGEGGTW
jgi:hypothetical protein